MKYVALLATFLLAACSGGNKQCNLDDSNSCPSGEVCESVQNQNSPACFNPVQLQGHVSDLSTAAPLGGATVSALDENGAPAASVAISATDGSYVLRIPSVRADSTGKPVGRKVALRAAAKNYFNFPAGVRVSLPIDTSAAAQANTSSPYVISGGQADIALIARRRNLPVLLHNRESGREMLELLRRTAPRERPGVFHSFTETADYGSRVIDLGFLVSFSGMITFRAADNIREAAAGLPLDAMLVETDTPFLAPAPHRGKPSEPAFVRETAAKLAEVKRTDLERVAEVTTSNFDRLFGGEPTAERGVAESLP